MNIDKFKDFKFAGKDISRIMYMGNILWERIKKVTFRKKLLYKNKDSYNNDKWIVIDVTLGLSASIYFWYYSAIWIDTWYNKVYIGSLPEGSQTPDSMTIPRDRLDFSDKFPSDYDIFNNMLYAKISPASAIDGYIVAPGYLIRYIEYTSIQNDTKSRFKIRDMTRLPSMTYSTSSSLNGYQDVINSVCSETIWDGFYILYSKKSYALNLMKVYNNNEVFNITISSRGGGCLI